MVRDNQYSPTTARASTTCLECGTIVGGSSGKDAYSHMLGCLNVEPDAVDRIRERADASRTENGKRVVHLCDFILGGN